MMNALSPQRPNESHRDVNMNNNKRIVQLLRADKGIGLQIAKDLAGHGFIVLVGSRNLAYGETAALS